MLGSIVPGSTFSSRCDGLHYCGDGGSSRRVRCSPKPAKLSVVGSSGPHKTSRLRTDILLCIPVLQTVHADINTTNNNVELY